MFLSTLEPGSRDGCLVGNRIFPLFFLISSFELAHALDRSMEQSMTCSNEFRGGRALAGWFQAPNKLFLFLTKNQVGNPAITEGGREEKIEDVVARIERLRPGAKLFSVPYLPSSPPLILVSSLNIDDDSSASELFS